MTLTGTLPPAYPAGMRKYMIVASGVIITTAASWLTAVAAWAAPLMHFHG